MSIDQVGRAAGADLREQVRQGTDAKASLTGLYVTARRRRRVQVAAAALVVVTVAGGVGWLARSSLIGSATGPTSNPTPTISSYDICDLPLFSCTPGGTIAMHLPSTVTWTVPDTFDRQLHFVTQTIHSDSGDKVRLLEAEAWRTDAQAGVVVIESAQPAKATPHAGVDHSIPPRAHSMAAWLTQRPLLVTSGVSVAQVGGYKSYTVETRLKNPDRGRVFGCDRGTIPCMPVVRTGPHALMTLGMMKGMTARFTFVQTPHDSPAVIWSWTFDRPSTLAGNQPLIDSLVF